MNSPGPSIEWSTRLSVARGITCVDLNSANGEHAVNRYLVADINPLELESGEFRDWYEIFQVADIHDVETRPIEHEVTLCSR